ncbi:hypothetical protein PaG_01859 [Moesziomyces aphidis]|uniref:Uncharacterized protein n=1 Tax=Moesziomyces aphidis TaxID=84754 RepID=W3VRY0_MOEAP|nr:hypothetical protein PaG_01859 [Moesziomyces aphidis]
MTVTQSDRRQPPTVSQSMCLPSGAEDGTGVDLPFNGIAAGRDFRFCYLAKRAECPDSLLGRVHVQPSSGIMLSTPPSHDPHDPAECISGCSLLDPLARNTSGDFAECASQADRSLAWDARSEDGPDDRTGATLPFLGRLPHPIAKRPRRKGRPSFANSDARLPESWMHPENCCARRHCSGLRHAESTLGHGPSSWNHAAQHAIETIPTATARS